MTAPSPIAATPPKPAARPKAPARKRTSLPITLEAFLHWKPEDGYKYEWNNGIIEKSEKMITPQQFYLIEKLLTLLEKVQPTRIGRLICEAGNMTSPTQLRIPDVAYYSKEEIHKAADGITWPVTAFAVEIISDNDKINRVFRKVEEYFRAGVRVVWLIFPQLQQVHVYNAPERVMICKGATLCSAENVIPGFALSVEDLFDKNA